MPSYPDCLLHIILNAPGGFENDAIQNWTGLGPKGFKDVHGLEDLVDFFDYLVGLETPFQITKWGSHGIERSWDHCVKKYRDWACEVWSLYHANGKESPSGHQPLRAALLEIYTTQKASYIDVKEDDCPTNLSWTRCRRAFAMALFDEGLDADTPLWCSEHKTLLDFTRSLHRLLYDSESKCEKRKSHRSFTVTSKGSSKRGSQDQNSQQTKRKIPQDKKDNSIVPGRRASQASYDAMESTCVESGSSSFDHISEDGRSHYESVRSKKRRFREENNVKGSSSQGYKRLKKENKNLHREVQQLEQTIEGLQEENHQLQLQLAPLKKQGRNYKIITDFLLEKCLTEERKR